MRMSRICACGATSAAWASAAAAAHQHKQIQDRGERHREASARHTHVRCRHLAGAPAVDPPVQRGAHTRHPRRGTHTHARTSAHVKAM